MQVARGEWRTAENLDKSAVSRHLDEEIKQGKCVGVSASDLPGICDTTTWRSTWSKMGVFIQYAWAGNEDAHIWWTQNGLHVLYILIMCHLSAVGSSNISFWEDGQTRRVLEQTGNNLIILYSTTTSHSLCSSSTLVHCIFLVLVFVVVVVVVVVVQRTPRRGSRGVWVCVGVWVGAHIPFLATKTKTKNLTQTPSVPRGKTGVLLCMVLFIHSLKGHRARISSPFHWNISGSTSLPFTAPFGATIASVVSHTSLLVLPGSAPGTVV